MATELGISSSTLDSYIARGIGIPEYRKLGEAKNSKVIWTIHSIFIYHFQLQTIS